MRKLLVLILFAALAGTNISADPMRAPVLQWYKTVSGSGVSDVTAVGTDSQGNLYITGNTTSLDFPVLAAAQSKAGGSPVTRINTASGSSQKLYATGLAAASSITLDPQNSNIIYATAGGIVMRRSNGGNTLTNLPVIPSVQTVH